MEHHNILLEIFTGYLKIGSGLFSYTYHYCNKIVPIQDFGLIALLTTLAFSYAVYSLIVKIVPVYSAIKATLVTTVPVMFFSVFFYTENTDKDITVHIENAMATTGMIWIVLITIFSVQMIMEAPYYEGLFGRFRDEDD